MNADIGLNRAARRKRSKGLLVSASLAAGSIFGYVGYTRPAFANGSTCSVQGNVGTVSGGNNAALVQSMTDCIADLSSGGVIDFDDNDVDETTVINVTTPFVIDKSLTIQGSSTTDEVWPEFDGGKAGEAGNYTGSNIFNSTSGNLTLREIGLVNGYAKTNAQQRKGAAVNKILSLSDSLVLDSVLVSGNTSTLGGAVYTTSNIEVKSTGEFQSRFENNSALTANGGAINSGLGNVTISNAVFNQNSTSVRGGAVFSYNGDISIDKSSFYANEAYSGGAVYFYNYSKNKKVDISNSTFYENIAHYGSAIFSDTDTGTYIDFSTVYKNYDLGSVGHPAIFVDSTPNGSSSIDNSIVAANSRDEDKSDFDDVTAGLAIDQYTFTSDDMPIGLNPVVVDDVFQFLAPDPGSDAVGAADPSLTFPQGGVTSSDQVGNVKVQGEANVGAINTTQEAIVESSPPSFSAPVPTTSPILTVEDNKPFSQGETVVARVSNATRVESVSIGDTEAEIISFEDGLLSFTVPELEAGSYSITGVFNSGTVIFDVGLEITGQTVSEEQELNVWTKKISDTEAKVYAKNPINNGKIQFFVDGEEIAWVRAGDSDDPKLSEAQGAFYLVRTVELTDSKQAIEIFVDGVRAWRAAYTAS